MNLNKILNRVNRYYSDKINTHGATAKGVDWNSRQSQRLRFEKLLMICDRSTPFSINDYGCGYGALAQYMTVQEYTFRYRGFDISEGMIAEAVALHETSDNCEFFQDESMLTVADYTVASGIFNVKLNTNEDNWKEYVLDTVETIAGISKEGFAFNLLTAYSDQDHKREDLFYGDPSFFFDHCKQNYSRFVSLIHDYPLYEFTILVKKER